MVVEFKLSKDNNLVLDVSGVPRVCNIPKPLVNSNGVKFYTFNKKRFYIGKLDGETLAWVYSYLIQLEDAQDNKSLDLFRSMLAFSNGTVKIVSDTVKQRTKRGRNPKTGSGKVIIASELESIEGLTFDRKGLRLDFAKPDSRKRKRQATSTIKQLLDGRFVVSRNRKVGEKRLQVLVKVNNLTLAQRVDAFLVGLSDLEFTLFHKNYNGNIPVRSSRTFVTKTKEYASVLGGVVVPLKGSSDNLGRSKSIAERELDLALQERELAEEKVRLATLKSSLLGSGVKIV